MQISARRHDKTTIFDVSGDIDFANSPEVRQAVLREIRESHTARVIVNLLPGALQASIALVSLP